MNYQDRIEYLKELCFNISSIEKLEDRVKYFSDKLKNIDCENKVIVNFFSTYNLDGEFTKDGFTDEIIADLAMSFFNNQIKWHSERVFHNLFPPILYDAVAIMSIVSLYNPNGLWDLNSGSAHIFEKKLVHSLSRLFAWDIDRVGGVMTFGGKATLLYAIKMGLNNVDRENRTSGISNNSVVMTGENGHYILESACSLLGIGIKNLVRVRSCYKKGIDLTHFENEFYRLIHEGKKIACIILSGGDTIDLVIDPIKKIRNIVDTAYEKNIISYRPFVHVDAVVSWAWLTFRGYNFEENILNLSEESLLQIKHSYNSLTEIEYADSVSVDFHKIGFVPYVSSMFITKEKKNFFDIFIPNNQNNGDKSYGDNFMQDHSIEHSRSVAPILGSWIALNKLGLDNIRFYISFILDLKIAANKFF